MTSQDGIVWTTRAIPFSQGINNIAWSQELGMLVITCSTNFGFILEME